MQSTGISTANSQTQHVDAAEMQQKTEAVKKLLSGSATGEMNLKAVRERGVALRKSIDELIDILQHQPHLLTWENTVERFGVITARHQQLTEQLRPLLKFYIARPLSVNQSNAEIIPLLLSTMQLPEMERAEAQALRDHDSQVAAQGLVQLYENLGNTIDGFNKIVEGMTKTGRTAAESGVLNPKSSAQEAMRQELKKAIDAGPRKAKPDESPAAKALVAAARGEGF